MIFIKRLFCKHDYQKEHKTAQDIRDQELLIKLFEGYNV